MGILLGKIRVHGFRGLDNLEIDFEPTTVLVGTNNAGKTTLLKALQLALSNSFQISDDDFFFSDEITRNKIVIDLLFISVDDNGNQINEFEDRIGIVFLIGMDEGTFPDYRAIAKGGEELQQEKNNTYVAFTRAKRFLFVSYPKNRIMPWGDTKSRTLSQFLKPLLN